MRRVGYVSYLGKCFLYCWEHNIDFYKVFCTLRDIEWQKYKEQCEQLYIPMKSRHNCPGHNLVGSTLELDVNILVSYFDIPIEEIFCPSNYTERLVKLLIAIGDECSALDREYEFFQEERIVFKVTCSVGNLMEKTLDINYEFLKYFDEEKLKFCYAVYAEVHPLQFRPLRIDKSGGDAYDIS